MRNIKYTYIYKWVELYEYFIIFENVQLNTFNYLIIINLHSTTTTITTITTAILLSILYTYILL